MKKKSAKKRILLVDDHPMLREGVARRINEEPDLEVCAAVQNAADALSAIEEHKPDLVLTDVTLPGRDGIDLILDVRATHPGLPILVFSVHDESLFAGRVLKAGARGYLMKSEDSLSLISGIRRAIEGEIVLGRRMTTALLEEYAGATGEDRASPFLPLTGREFSVFQLLGQAKSNSEIARQLHLSPKTVETHCLNIRHKLKLRSSRELMRHAIRFVEQDLARE